MSDKNWWESMTSDAGGCALVVLLLGVALIGALISFIQWLVDQIVATVLVVVAVVVCVLAAFFLWALLYFLWKLVVLEWGMQEEMDDTRKKIARQERLIRSVEDQIATLSPADQQAAQPRLQELRDKRDQLIEKLSDKACTWADYLAQNLDTENVARQKILGQLGREKQAKLTRKLASSEARINKLETKIEIVCREYGVQPDPHELRWQRMFPALDRVVSWIATWRDGGQ